MNDARRQLLHEAYKMVDVTIMVVGFLLAVLVAVGPQGFHVGEVTDAWHSAAPDRLAGPADEPQAEAAEEPAPPSADPTPDLAGLDRADGADEAPPPGAESEPGAVAPAEGDGGEEAAVTPTRRGREGARAPGSRPGRPSSAVAPEVPDVPLITTLLDRLPASWLDGLAWFRDKLGWERMLFFFAAIFAWHATFTSRGLYNSRRLDSPLGEAVDVVRAGFLGSLLVDVLTLLTVKDLFPLLQENFVTFGVTFFVLATGTTVVARLAIRYTLEQMRLRGRNLRGVLIVGTNPRALRFAKGIEAKPTLGYYVVGFVDEEWDGIAGFKRGGGRLVSNLANLGAYLASNVVDEVVVALPVSSAYVHSSRIVSLCQEQGITIRFVSQIFDSRLAKGRLDIFGGEPMLSLEGTPDQGFAKLLKTLLDRLVAGVLIVLLAPVLAFTALAVKLTSPGPVLFVQRRVGLNKRTFEVYKFRTMVPDAEARLEELEHLNQVSGPVFKLENDPRLTPIGDFLRKTSIDELPQLFNVFKGEMSLVGPRPLPERDYKGFDTDAHRRRLSVRPGITCTWQVKGRNSIPFEEWMRLDLEYIDNWSLWLDFKILLRTIPVVLGPLFLGKSGEFTRGVEKASGGGPAGPRGSGPRAEGVGAEAMASGSGSSSRASAAP
ncbi:MAG: exopolysaccharide biosynthesis polyprenyl glycosylphosphotransferase [Holophagales bacterium]|nr:exopolysaccharide biosynthesis polyprenyl glycosylphosphotransferase [Holophagales bacterium]